MTDPLDPRRFVLAFEHIRDSVLASRDWLWPDGSCRCDVVKWDRVEHRPVLLHDDRCLRRNPLVQGAALDQNPGTTTSEAATAPTVPPHGPEEYAS